MKCYTGERNTVTIPQCQLVESSDMSGVALQTKNSPAKRHVLLYVAGGSRSVFDMTPPSGPLATFCLGVGGMASPTAR